MVDNNADFGSTVVGTSNSITNSDSAVIKAGAVNNIRLEDDISANNKGIISDEIGEAVKDNATNVSIIPIRGANSINEKMLMPRHVINENDNDNNSLSSTLSTTTNNADVYSNSNSNSNSNINMNMNVNTNIYESMAAASAAVAAVDKFSNNNHFTGLSGMNYGPNNALFIGGGTNMNAINQINPGTIDSNINMNFNINPYLVATTTSPPPPYQKDENNNVNVTMATAAPIPNFNNNANNHAAILQQYAAIMQQNNKALQHLQKTNNFFTALNPVLIDPPIGAVNKPKSIITAANPMMDTNNNIDVNAIADANVAGPAMLDQLKVSSPPPDQQKQSAQTIVIGCVPSGNETSQLQNGETTNNTNNNIIDNNNKTANILRTATMLQNGAPFLQPQFESSHVANTNNSNSNSKINGNTSATSSSNNDNRAVGNSEFAAAAANAAASVLPMATMNSNNLIPPSFSFPMIGGGSHNILNYQNTIMSGKNTNDNFYNAAAAVASANSGLISLQQQAFQQHSQAMVSHLQQQQQQQQQYTSTSQPSSNDIDISPDQKQKHKPKRKLHLSRPLYLDHDSNCLTAYQCFLRKQIELFEAGHEEMHGTAQGRNTPIHYRQVGIRCRHCSHLPKSARARGGVYFSRTIDGVYQVAQNMSKIHFMQACTLIPEQTKSQLRSLQSVSSRASGGKEYWAEGLRVLGIVEERGMLRFASNSTINEDDDR